MTNNPRDTMKKTPGTTQAGVIPILFQGAFSFAAITYAIGFLIVNSSYAQYGFTAENISQTKYVSTGLLFVLLYSSIAIINIGAKSFFQEGYRRLFPFIISIVLSGFAYLFSDNPTSALLVFISTPPFLFVLEWLWEHPRGQSQSYVQWQIGSVNLDVDSTLALAIKAMTGLFFTTLIIYVWANYLWIYISPAMGGGRPGRGVILLNQEAIKPLGTIGLAINQSGITEPYLILFDNADEVVVLVDAFSEQERVIKIARDLIISITYIPRGFDGAMIGPLGLTPTITSPLSTITPISTVIAPPSPDNTSVVMTPTITVSTTPTVATTP